ncbi:hypothetical protein HUT19_02520 [Streptomyces sp. NA02950]|nr:hypothetical protein [Streptomyces sp. NA02950]QKV90756.1 hypothetical protein HUT19_02520 [Streptomyces sp. NA02950]
MDQRCHRAHAGAHDVLDPRHHHERVLGNRRVGMTTEFGDEQIGESLRRL